MYTINGVNFSTIKSLTEEELTVLSQMTQKQLCIISGIIAEAASDSYSEGMSEGRFQESYYNNDY